MPAQFASGSFFCRTTGGVQTIPTPFPAKAIILMGAGVVSSDGVHLSLARQCLGFATSPTDQRCVASTAYESGSNAVSRATQTADSLLRFGSTSSTASVEAVLTAIAADSFTLNFTAASSGWLVHWIIIGGDDVEAETFEFQAPTTLGSHAVSSLTLTDPDCVLLASTVATTSNPSESNSVSTAAYLGWLTREGSGVGQGVSCWRVTLNSAPSLTAHLQSSAHCLTQHTTTTLLTQAEAVSLDAHGMTLNWTTVSSAYWQYGLALSGVSAKALSFVQPTAAPGAQALSGVGFAPLAALVQSAGQAAASGIQVDLRRSFGLATGDAQGGGWLAFTDNQTSPMVVNSYGHAAAAVSSVTPDAATPTVVAQATVESFDADGLTLDWTTIDATPREWLALVWGVAGGGPAPQDYPTINRMRRPVGTSSESRVRRATY